MFSNLRQGSQVYVFHKCASTPYIEMGSVEIPNQFGSLYQMPGIPMNISIRIGDKVVPFPNLPPNSEVADVTNTLTGETITLACNKEAVNAEVQSERQKSVDTLNSVEYHKQRITALDTLIGQLNPEIVEKQQQAQEICSLKSELASMRELIEQLKGERASSSKVRKEQ